MRIIVAFVLAATLTACVSAPSRSDHLAGAVASFTGQDSTRYQHASVDLNGDGVADAIVLLQGMEWCGSGGCTMLVLKGDGAEYAVVSSNTVTRAPIRVLDSVSDSWRDIIVHSDGVEKLMSFDGSGYPSNPSMAPTASQEQIDAAEIIIR